jgi:predicted permease
MDGLLQDVRYGVRVLMKAPVVTGVAVLTLALGIGANTAIFSLADAFLWSRLPVKDPEQLVFVYAWLPSGRTEWSFPHATVERFRDANQSLSGLFAYDDTHVAVTIDGQPEYVDADFVSGSYFDVLGVGAGRGRTFTVQDDQPGRAVVAVLSDGYWQRRFARDPAVVGRTIYVGKVPVTIIGVTPPGFFGRKVAGRSADLVLPMFIQPRLALKDHDTFAVMARLAPGVPAEQARQDLDLIYRRALTETAGAVVSPQAAQEIRQRAIQLAPGVRGTSNEGTDLGTQLPILLAVVGIVLLIACVNVANLQLARATARQKEIAVRLSIGAGRGRLVRQLLTESVLLGILGGALGLLLAGWGVGVLTAVLSTGRSPIVFTFGANPRLLAFTAAVSLLTGVLFGLVPALSATRVDLSPMFKGGAERSTPPPWRRRMAQSLVVSQMALSLALLVGAGLLIRTLQRLYSVDPGFEREKVLLTWVLPALNGYDEARESALYRELLARMNAMPGVQSATLSRYRLVTGRPYRDVWVRRSGSPADEGRRVYCGVVGPRFFETMGITLLQGREFSSTDDAAAPRVAVISESLARAAFPGANAIGRQIGFDGSHTADDAQVIGVVRDLNRRLVERSPEDAIYVPVSQAPPDSLGQMNLVLRTAARPASVTSALRSAVRSIDKDLPLEAVQTQAQEVDDYLGGRRALAQTLGFFGALALLLAAIGLYGTMSYAVGRRTREIGIRLALGAQRTDMLWMVLREASLQVVAGIAVGAVIALAAARLIASVLFGVGVTDPLTFAAAVLVMTATALAASYLPARRATRVDPMVSLRYE